MSGLSVGSEGGSIHSEGYIKIEHQNIPVNVMSLFTKRDMVNLFEAMIEAYEELTGQRVMILDEKSAGLIEER